MNLEKVPVYIKKRLISCFNYSKDTRSKKIISSMEFQYEKAGIIDKKG